MDRNIVKIDSSHDAEVWRMAGPAQRDAQMRIYPHPLPSGYHLTHEWSGNDLMHLTIKPEAITLEYVLNLCKLFNITVTGGPAPLVGEPITAVAIPKPAANVPHTAPRPGSPADVEDKRLGARRARVSELAKKDKNDLKRIAAETGLGTLSTSLSQAQMADKIVTELEAKEKAAAEKAKEPEMAAASA